jgi:hypothetical protein
MAIGQQDAKNVPRVPGSLSVQYVETIRARIMVDGVQCGPPEVVWFFVEVKKMRGRY